MKLTNLINIFKNDLIFLEIEVNPVQKKAIIK